MTPGDAARTWGIAYTSIGVNGYYEFPDLYGDDTPYTVCLDITPATEWTLDMVREWGVAVDPAALGRRCITTAVSRAPARRRWTQGGRPHRLRVVGEQSVQFARSLSEDDIECTITATNEGETILYGAYDAGVLAEDYYPCSDYSTCAAADPAPDVERRT